MKKQNKMKKTILILIGAVIMMTACKKGEVIVEPIPVDNPAVKFVFKNYYDGAEVTKADFNTIKYTNAVGNNHSITRLRYLVSNITLHKVNGEEVNLGGYNFVDLNESALTRYHTPDVAIPAGKYSGVSITFGFNPEDNITGAYQDLNAASWGWPMMIGGGYHFLQFEGKFIDTSGTQKGFAYHMGTASKKVAGKRVHEDNHFRVRLWDMKNGGFELDGEDDVEIEINMNLEQWFTNTYDWNLNYMHMMLMPNYEAQRRMQENGQTVFSLGNVNRV